MPITKRFEVNKYLGDFEEIDEYCPFFNDSFFEEEEVFPKDETTLNISFWKKWWAILKLKFTTL